MTSAVNYVATIAFIPYFYKIDTIHAYIIVKRAAFNLILLPFIANKIENPHKMGQVQAVASVQRAVVCGAARLYCGKPQFQKESARIIYAYLTCCLF